MPVHDISYVPEMGVRGRDVEGGVGALELGEAPAFGVRVLGLGF